MLQAYVENHPPDELARLTAGRNLGWPFCDPDPDAKRGGADTAEDHGNMRSTPTLRRTPEGSSLPSPWDAGAVVAVHGSRDRDPPRAPAELWLPWNTHTHGLGAATTLVGGFQEPRPKTGG